MPMCTTRGERRLRPAASIRVEQLGWEQAKQPAQPRPHPGGDSLPASPLLRARQTAGVIAERLGLDHITISALITEVLTGYQGEPFSIRAGRLNFYDTPASPSDETIAGIAARMGRFLERARRRHAGQTVVAVSHADPIMILRAKVLGLPLVIASLQGPEYPAKCSVTRFTFAAGDPTPAVNYLALTENETQQADAALSGSSESRAV